MVAAERHLTGAGCGADVHQTEMPQRRTSMSNRMPGLNRSAQQDRNGRWLLLPILHLIGTVSLLASVVAGIATYLGEADERAKARQDASRSKHYLAWALINAARGASAEVGLRYALQDLNEDH